MLSSIWAMLTSLARRTGPIWGGCCLMPSHNSRDQIEDRHINCGFREGGERKKQEDPHMAPMRAHNWNNDRCRRVRICRPRCDYCGALATHMPTEEAGWFCEEHCPVCHPTWHRAP